MTDSRSPISTLPFETLLQILDDVAVNSPLDFELIDRQSLYHCSLVCSRWVDASLERLYQHIRIDSKRKMEALAQSPALSRYRTECLVINFDYCVTPLDYRDLERVFDACSGLRTLIWEVAGDYNLEWTRDEEMRPLDVLFKPTMSSLKHLQLPVLDTFDSLNASDMLSPLMTVPFRLNSFATNLENLTIAITNLIVEASITHDSSSLTSLNFSSVLMEDRPEQMAHVDLFFADAPTILYLSLPAMDCKSGFFDRSGFFQNTMQFLRLATSLSHLSVGTDHLTEAQDMPPTLSRVFEAVSSSLEIFTYDARTTLVTQKVLDIMEKAMQPKLALAHLRRLEFPKVKFSELSLTKGWAKFDDGLKQKGIKLVTLLD